MARPSEFDMKICEEICFRVSGGENIANVLESDDRFPCVQTWQNWKRKHPLLLEMYTNAQQDKAEVGLISQIDKTIESLENGLIDYGTAKIKIDTLKWKAAKFYPKMFVDKQVNELVGKDGSQIIWNEVKTYEK